MESPIMVQDHVESDEEIFFGNIGEIENKVTKRLRRRKTDMFNESFRNHMAEDFPGSFHFSLASLEPRLMEKTIPISESVKYESTLKNQKQYKSRESANGEHNVDQITLLLRSNVNLSSNLHQEEDEISESTDTSKLELSCSFTAKSLTTQSGQVNFIEKNVTPSRKSVCSTPQMDPSSIAFRSSLDSSPEADFFILESSLEHEPENIPHPPNIHLIEALDLSRNSLGLSNQAKWVDSPEINSLNLHTSICARKMNEELNRYQLSEISNKAGVLNCNNENVREPNHGVKHQLKPDDSLHNTSEAKRPRGLYWSPRPNYSYKQKSLIPVPIGSNEKSKTHTGFYSAEKRFPTLKKWDIMSPVAQYIRNQPLPPLFKNVKPLREIPIDVIPNAAGNFQTHVNREKSPTVSTLPAAQYTNSTPRAGQTLDKPVSKIEKPYYPSVIRHKGPSKAFPGVAHLSYEGYSESIYQSEPSKKPFNVKPHRETDLLSNKSVFEFVELHRTNTLLPVKSTK